MRRFFIPLALFAALAVPTLAAGAGGDGTLSVKDANGTIAIAAKGAIVGRVDSGTVRVHDPNPDDAPGPIVWGAEARSDVSDKTTVYIGNNIRFRSVGGSVRIRVRGVGIDLSVVGRGTVTLDGEGSEDDGLFSLNGEEYESLPEKATSFPLTPARAD